MQAAALRRILPSINLGGMQRVVYLRYGPALLASVTHPAWPRGAASIHWISGEFVDRVDNSQTDMEFRGKIVVAS